MPDVVVDTNVLIAANTTSETDASTDCSYACIEALKSAREQIVLLDDQMLILTEYMGYASFAGQPGVGDAFFKWVWNQQANTQYCRKVGITPSDAYGNFLEFPDDDRLETFDLSDRKFVAVVIASETDPEILNATDSDWWDHRIAFSDCGIRIRFLCPERFN